MWSIILSKGVDKMNILTLLDITLLQLIWVAFAAFLIGFSKTGISGQQ